MLLSLAVWDESGLDFWSIATQISVTILLDNFHNIWLFTKKIGQILNKPSNISKAF